MKKIYFFLFTFLFSFSGFSQENIQNKDETLNKTEIQGQNQKQMLEIYELCKIKSYQRAKEKLQGWMETSPASFPVEGYLILGSLYDHERLFLPAVQIYEKGLLQASNKIPFYLNLSQVYRRLKEYQRSLDYLELLQDDAFRIPEVYLFKGMALFELRNRMGVIAAWENYLAQKPVGVKSDKVRRALDWLKRKDFKWPEDLEKEDALKAEDMKQFLEDLKTSVSKEREAQIRQNPEVKEEKLEIQDQGVQEGESFDEVER